MASNVSDENNEKPRYRKGFTKNEDLLLVFLVQKFSTNSWKTISCYMQERTPRQCRERWRNYLEPSINRTEWTQDEDQRLCDMVTIIGKKWSLIKKYFSNRSYNSIKNRWYALFEEKFQNSLKASKAGNLNNDGNKNSIIDFIDWQPLPEENNL